jgi:hypothetical protein
MLAKDDVKPSERRAAQQRFSLRAVLNWNESRMKDGDMAVVDQLRGAKTAEAYDAMLAKPEVVDLFRRQVVYFGDVQ